MEAISTSMNNIALDEATRASLLKITNRIENHKICAKIVIFLQKSQKIVKNRSAQHAGLQASHANLTGVLNDMKADQKLKKNSIFCDRREQKIIFSWNFERNCHQNAKQDSGQISNFGFRSSDSEIDLHSEIQN